MNEEPKPPFYRTKAFWVWFAAPVGIFIAAVGYVAKLVTGQ